MSQDPQRDEPKTQMPQAPQVREVRLNPKYAWLAAAGATLIAVMGFSIMFIHKFFRLEGL